MIAETYGWLHRTARRLLGRTYAPDYRMVSVPQNCMKNGAVIGHGHYINEKKYAEAFLQKDIFPVENIVAKGDFENLPDSFVMSRKLPALGIKREEARNKWHGFIKNAKIPKGYRNGGLRYAGYIGEASQWCLPSWIWTNAAIVRMYCRDHMIPESEEIARILLSLQTPCGGWIVRNDYDAEGAIPVLAPNDSAYIANNACLEMYQATMDIKYLAAAERCAEWIVNTSRPDGMVYVGFDTRREMWQKKHNIVDVGFTAGLFARLFQITGKEQYRRFLERFVQSYTELFYERKKGGFATSLDANDNRLGGMFGRGQAWALEGLIPAYNVIKSEELRGVIDGTVDMLLKKQANNGGWAYNITRPLMGQDCKAIPVIACSLMEWSKCFPDRKDLLRASMKAMQWCLNHTANHTEAVGGIFCYSTEGAVVHHMYTNTAFVYASAYAIELEKCLNEVSA